MKRFVVVLFFLCVCFLNAEVYTEIRSGSCSMPETDGLSFRSSVFTSVEFGKNVCDNFRIGLGLNYTKFDVKNGDAARNHFLTDDRKARTYIASLFLNSYRDFSLSNIWSIYVGGGVGIARLRVFTVNIGGQITSDAKNLLARQVMLGVTRKISECWAISSGYRCMKLANASNIKDNGLNVNESQYRTPLLHCFEVGLRYTF